MCYLYDIFMCAIFTACSLSSVTLSSDIPGIAFGSYTRGALTCATDTNRAVISCIFIGSGVCTTRPVRLSLAYSYHASEILPVMVHAQLGGHHVRDLTTPRHSYKKRVYGQAKRTATRSSRAKKTINNPLHEEDRHVLIDNLTSLK